MDILFFYSFFYDVLICCVIKAEWNILNMYVKKKKKSKIKLLLSLTSNI